MTSQEAIELVAATAEEGHKAARAVQAISEATFYDRFSGYLGLSIAERFWPKVDKRGVDECWKWLASTQKFGYGTFNLRGKIQLAHRISWMLHNGPIPKGKGYHGTCVLHHCDNPPCVNPKHLFLGTNNDNMADKVKKGRIANNIGEQNCNAKLTWEQVCEIRVRYAKGGITQTKLGDEFGVTNQNISDIIRGKLWNKQ